MGREDIRNKNELNNAFYMDDDSCRILLEYMNDNNDN